MIEELKMILEMVNSTVGLAHDFGIKFLWMYFGTKFLEWVFVVFASYGVYSLFRYAILACAGKDTTFLRECRTRLRTGTSGFMTEEEYTRTTNKILELIDKYNQGKANRNED